MDKDGMTLAVDINVKKNGSNNDAINDKIRKNSKEMAENTKDAKFSAASIKKSLTTAFNNTKVVAWVKTLKNGVDLLIRASKAQSDFIESINYMNSAYGSIDNVGASLARSLSFQTGYDEAVITKQLAQYRQLGDTFGMASEQAELLASNIVQLSMDIGAMQNKDFDKVGEDIMSAMLGNAKAVRELQADVTELSLQETALAYGIEKQYSAMNKSERAILTYLTVERQLTDANGALANSYNSTANQIRVFNAQIETLKRQFSALADLLLSKVLPVINGILIAFNEILGFFLGLAHIDAQSVADNMSSSFGSLGDTLDTVAQSSEKAKKGLRGFDKLNNITTPTPSSGSGVGSFGAIDSGILAALDAYNSKLETASKHSQEIAKNIMHWLGFTEEFNEETKRWEWKWDSKRFKDNIKNGIKNLFKDIWKWIKENWDKILVVGLIVLAITLVKKIFGNSSKEVSKKGEILAKAGNKIAGAFQALAIGAAGLMILAGVAMVIGSVTEMMKTMAETGMETKDVLILFGGIFAEIALGIGLVVLALKKMDWEAIAAGIVILGGLALILYELNGLLQTIGELGMSTGDILLLLGGLLGELIVAMTAIVILAKVLSSDPLAMVGVLVIVGALVILLEIMKDTLPTILDVVGKFIDKIAPHLINLLETIGNIIEDIIYALGIALPPIIESLGHLFDSVFGGISNVIQTVGDVIIGIMETAGTTINNVLGSILWFIRELGPAIETFVDSAIRSITKVINFVISGVEFLVNALIKAWNKLVDVLNKLGMDVDKKPQVQLDRFQPTLYEDGGFPQKGELFVMNEANNPEMLATINGKTAVANTDQITDGISIGVAKALMATKGKDDKIVIEAKGDTSGLLDFITFEQRKRERQYGL